MGLRVSFELNEDDLKHFRLIMRESRKAAAAMSPEEIVARAEALLDDTRNSTVPHFIEERLEKLHVMIRMLRDHQWRLPAAESGRVVNALAYFGEPDDLIPDHIPGLGFLDDAIMVELVVRELKHEIEAYRDFCEYRSRHLPARGIKHKSSDMTRDRWLEKRRKELQARMRRRRKRDRGGRQPLDLL
ncbi:MAG: YkvA family protein [Woeseiaceae bacterium]|nr:YkvA family protein [Woeseiaceae bacterium]